MALNTRHFNILPYPPRLNKAAEKLTQFQADFVSDALRRAVEDAGAAMAHQLSEPLTTLLLYLHGIKQVGRPCEGTETVPASVREMVNMALRATERVWEIMEQVGPFEAPADADAAVARGCEAIDLWKNSRARGDASRTPSVLSQHPLTAREREVLTLIIAGASNKEGGHRLGISTRTFEAHRAHLMAKLGAKNVADLLRIALSARR
jgi:DNA-binding CsgD family transcriptional regulator